MPSNEPRFREPPFHEPMFNVPPAVIGVLALLVGVEMVMAALPETMADWLTLALAFIPARYSGFPEPIPGGAVASVTSFLTYALVHANLFHLGVNSVWLVAFGGAVANRVGSSRFLLLSAACAVAGAAAFLAMNTGRLVPMVGASGAVSGLMGATMRFLFSATDHGGGLRALRENPQSIPVMPLADALVDKRMLGVTAAFVLANALGVLGLGGVSAGGIAWEAHLGGYAAGLVLFGLFVPQQTHWRANDNRN